MVKKKVCVHTQKIDRLVNTAADLEIKALIERQQEEAYLDQASAILGENDRGRTGELAKLVSMMSASVAASKNFSDAAWNSFNSAMKIEETLLSKSMED